MMKNRGIFISVSSLVGVERRKRDVHWVPRPSMRPSASMRLVRLCRLRMSNRQDGSLDGAIRARRGANEFTAGFAAVKSLSTWTGSVISWTACLLRGGTRGPRNHPNHMGFKKLRSEGRMVTLAVEVAES
jgi:hypothetical protein